MMPWMIPMVTMSPFATCESSCPSTALSSSRLMRESIAEETATRASSLFQPVAKALTSLLCQMPTSGIFTPFFPAMYFTVSTSHLSSSLRGTDMVLTP